MSGSQITTQQRFTAGPKPMILFAAAIWIFWGLGYETVWQRFALELEGTVIARQEIPRSPATHGTGTVYIVRGADGVDHTYVSGATDGSLPRNIRIGANIEKRRWELSYSLNGVRVDDFPRYFYSAMCGVALACVLWAALQLVRRHGCEIAPNGDPTWEFGTSLILLANSPVGWGHGWTRKVTRLIAILRSGIKEVGLFGGGVIVARDFAP